MRVDLQRHPADAVDVQLHRGDAAEERRTIVLHAGRHVDHLRLDVLRDQEQQVVGHRALSPGGQGAADRDVERRRPGDTGADRGFAARPHLEAFGLEVVEQARRPA